jgi:hypothetical protein
VALWNVRGRRESSSPGREGSKPGGGDKLENASQQKGGVRYGRTHAFEAPCLDVPDGRHTSAGP